MFTMLKIVKIDLGNSSKADDLIDGKPREYKKVTVMGAQSKEVIDPFTGEKTIAIGEVKQTAFVVWKNDHHSIGGKLNPSYATMTTNKMLLGEIVKREVNDYEIPDRITGEARTVTSATVVVFGDSSSENWENEVRQAFTNKGFILTSKVPTVEPEVIVQSEVF